MPRTIGQGTKVEATAQQSEFVVLLELAFSGGTIRYCTGGQDIIWNNNTYTAVGGAIGFQDLSESSDLSASGVTITASGVDQSIVQTLLQQSYIGRSAKVYLAHVNRVGEMFTLPISGRWVLKAGGGTATQPGGISEAGYGPQVLRSTGYTWYEWSENVPFDPTVLYSIRIRVRRTVDASDAASDLVYCGVAGVASDGTTYVATDGTNTFSSQHYFAALGQRPALNTWTEYVGYWRGTGASPGAQHPDPANPGVMHTGVSFFRPLVILNYPGTVNDGVYDVELIEWRDPVVTSPLLLFSGYMNDGWTIQESRPAAGGGTVTIQGRCVDRLAALDQRRGIQPNIGAHQSAYPAGYGGDLFFQYVGQVLNYGTVKWSA